MTSKLGLHWLREHPDNNRDLAHVEAMQYKSIKLFKPAWDNAGFCRDLLAVLPSDSYILARDQPLSEQKEGMWSKPEEHGIYHANEWAMKVASGQYHLPVERTFFLGINEPDATTGDRNAIDLYTAAFLNRLQTHGLRGGAFNFSTGHPRTVDGTPNTMADYSVFERSHQAIVKGHHIGVLHIYGTGAVPLAPGNYDRLQACTWQDVEWVVGEFGVDEHVIGGGEHAGFHKFFNGRLDEYCGWLDVAIFGIGDPRIHSYQVFTYDFSHPWGSFDITPIREALERFDWRHMKQAHPPTPPQPPAKPTTAYVAVVNGANIRVSPVFGDVLAAVAYGEQVDVLGMEEMDGDGPWWSRVRYQGYEGWMLAALLSDTPPVKPGPTPEQPAPVTGDEWNRAWPIVLKIEGGLSTDRSDKGNYRPDGTFVGTKWGISALSHPTVDIVNLTKEQALEIYHRNYWLGGGCDKLPWPMALLHFDAYVQNEVAAKKFLKASNGDPDLYMAARIDWYTTASTWDSHGRGWMRRCATMLREVANAWND